MFKKKQERKYTWISPNKMTKNEIDYILIIKENVINNTEIINQINLGSDHRMIGSTMTLNTKFERSKNDKKNNIQL